MARTIKTVTYRVQIDTSAPKFDPGHLLDEWSDVDEEFSTPDAAQMHMYELIRMGVATQGRVIRRTDEVMPR